MVHAQPRRRGKARSRILYWFRTPPGVKVGRAALDEEAIRLLEANHPDLEFDWTRILKGQAPAPAAERGARAPQPRAVQSRPESEAAAPRHETPPAEPRPDAMDADAGQEPVEPPAEPAAPTMPEEPTSAAHGRLGSDALGRLRARYAEMLARISERIPEPERQEQLKALAERLNPDGWVTDADVTSGLESYERTFDELRGPLGGRRKPS